jgi:hypothetical protein
LAHRASQRSNSAISAATPFHKLSLDMLQLGHIGKKHDGTGDHFSRDGCFEIYCEPEIDSGSKLIRGMLLGEHPEQVVRRTGVAGLRV